MDDRFDAEEGIHGHGAANDEDESLMPPPDRRNDATERFRSLYEANFRAISGYVRRRLTAGVVSEAPDVIAEVFAVAWRRIDSIPPPPEDRLWLYGVARHALLHHGRSTWRRQRLRDRLEGERAASAEMQWTDPVDARLHVAIARLRPRDQEVLRLTFWEGLTHAETARVLGCSQNAVASRIKRAKALIRRDLAMTEVPLFRRAIPARPLTEGSLQS